jgi:hypothetical protein
MQLFMPDRHESITQEPWSEQKAWQTIYDINQSALDSFAGENFWPVHPDLQNEYKLHKPITGLWFGAAGTIWALTELQNRIPRLPKYDFSEYLQQLIHQQAASFGEFDPKMKIDPHSPGYLLGYAGLNLLTHKLLKSKVGLNELEKNIEANIHNPINELMWAAPGTMLCAWFMFQQTQETQWQTLFQKNVEYLFSIWDYNSDYDCHVWTQHMYGENVVHLGPIHGFSGIIFSMLKGFDLLNSTQKATLIERAEKTLLTSALVTSEHANWLPCLGKARAGREQPLLHVCHGAPGVVIASSALWEMASTELHHLLRKASQLIWDAGPLKKPWGLCHGSAGNGYAFLKMHQLTGEDHWLDKARAFAMHAIKQYEDMRQQYNCIRTDAWCGDLGLAIFLHDCITIRCEFPMMDYF